MTVLDSGRRARTGAPAAPLRRTPGWLSAGLYRPLAEDDERARYWVRHVQTGVLLSEIAGWACLVYTMTTPTPGHRHPVLLALAGAVVVLTPLVLLLPLDRVVRDLRGPLLFYAWNVAVTAIVTTAAAFDGGADSPLPVLFFLVLVFMAVAYPPAGVVLTGALMTTAYVLLVDGPLGPQTLLVTTVLATVTLICTLSSANQWAAQDRQVLLLRTQEALATTDPLTGVPNRRVFLDRVGRAVATRDGRSVVCIVDLDGFKGVNDRDGHAAGDAVLRRVAAALGAAVRETDTVARLGGDEFAVLALSPGPADDAALADRVRAAVAGAGAGCGVTASVGLALVGPGDDVAGVLHRADGAMYRAKAAGGDRVGDLAG
ncbi:GGDEF domain-containing protein [Geodermatophilus nigrescens]|uniref:Diguanylate cyclase (GGDEF) domain-containing protein n=1 Tax=Geodermatophilus nigrescens TaxID=1070870 RepID=A0A1M5FZT1_9ACTN|nr:GGDEF domain-containing protein [Geodermatophilus nigrescens]SHF96672.1 diguanylate cyclase (GGDEF) domain-containing protein [Geodermatophilus nigrescens]